MCKTLFALITALTLTSLWILPVAADVACTPANTTLILESEPNNVFVETNQVVDIPAPSSGRCLLIQGGLTAVEDVDSYRLRNPAAGYFISSNHDEGTALTLLLSAPTLGLPLTHSCQPLRSVCQIDLRMATGTVVDFIIMGDRPGHYSLFIRQ